MFELGHQLRASGVGKKPGIVQRVIGQKFLYDIVRRRDGDRNASELSPFARTTWRLRAVEKRMNGSLSESAEDNKEEEVCDHVTILP